MKKLSENQMENLINSIESFNEHIESFNESMYEYYIESWENGEYSCSLESSHQCNIEHGTNISEDLQIKIKLSDLTIDEFIDEIISNNYFKCEYEKLSNPFHYGGPDENEIYSIPMGEWENQEDSEYVQNYKPGINLKEYFESKNEFIEFINNEFSYQDNLNQFWAFFAENSTHEFFIDNYDYDVVRFIIDVENYEDEINEILLSETSIKEYFKKIHNKEFNEFLDNNKNNELLDSFIELLNYNNIESIEIDEIINQLESIDDNGQLHEMIDSNIEIYNYQLREWAVDNYEYCERAVDEGLYSMENFDFHSFIQAGQYVYYSEQAYELLSELKEILE